MSTQVSLVRRAISAVVPSAREARNVTMVR